MANNTIKGLTVEIGGDTTKLGKALEDVNKKSRSLSGELGQINKLLKLDPGNADLLAQKQKVLAEAVSNTSEKLEKLKAAEKQVQKQFQRGEASEEQVRALKREIIETEKKMDGYKKAIKETTRSLDKMEDSTKKTEKASSGLGTKLKSLGSSLGKVAAGGAKALAGGITAVSAACIASAEASREYRREMGKLDTAFTTAGHSSEAAQKTYKTLQGVLGETDQAVEAANHLAKLTDNEKDLQEWTDICTGVYATFGASLPIEGLTEAANETAKVGQVTGPLADALNWAGVSEDKFNESLAACSSEQERQALITETLSGLYDEAAEKYKETNAEVIRANQANEEWAAATAEVGAAVEPLLTDIKSLGASLVSDLAPGIKEVTGSLRGMLSGDEGAAADFGEAVSGIISQILNKITEMLPAIAEMGMSLITTLTTNIILALPQLVATLTEVVLTLVQGITNAIPQVAQAIVTAFPHIVQAGVQLFMGLVQAIPQVLIALLTALPQVVLTIVQALVGSIPQLIQGTVQFFMAIIDAIPQVIPPIIAAIPQLVTALVDGIVTSTPLLIQGALQLLHGIIDAIQQIIPPLAAAIPQIIDALVDGLLIAVPQLVEGSIQLLNAIIDAIPVLIDALVPEIPGIVNAIIDALIDLTPMLLDAAITLFFALVDAIPTIVGALIARLPAILAAIIGSLKRLPALLWTILSQAVKTFVRFAAEGVKSAATGAAKIVKGIVDGLKDLPSKMGKIGKDLVKGLWNGIKDMVGWITGKLEGFGDSVLSGIKNFFGIKSPSRVFKNEVGKMLAVGLAEGIEDNANQPLEAMSALSSDLLNETEAMNGLTLERRLNHTFTAPATPTAGETGVMNALGKILTAIERGQILTIDGEALIGATANQIDNALGRRRALAARGAM